MFLCIYDLYMISLKRKAEIFGMPRRNDHFLRKLGPGDPARYLRDRTPAQSWFKPDRVTLSTLTIPLGGEHGHKSFDSGFSPLQFLAGYTPVAQNFNSTTFSALEFVQDPHWRESAPRTNAVRPQPSIFDQFLRLAEAPDHQIQEFASQFGALLIFCRIDLAKVPKKLVIVESCDVWRYFAASMRCLLRIANCFHNDRRPDPADWAGIGACPASLIPAESDVPDLLSPYGFGAEEAWTAMVHFVRTGSDRDRKMWTRLLNVLLELGKVRSWLLWERSVARPELVFTGPSLLSYLALQLCLRASKHDAFAVCSYCNCQYAPAERAPKAGQRNFCPDCRSGGVPIRIAQRSRRERLRAKTGT